jgi:nucleoside-diphosphate-sugar epimerase
MNVLLTGANGFVGSHILDALVARSLAVTALLRRNADTRLIDSRRAQVEIRTGSLADLPSLEGALKGITHVIHCAGRTKALRVSEYYETNENGTRHLIDAVNRTGAAVQRLVLVSSLAASHPAVAAQPAREADPPAPVSDYGKSKLRGEEVVRRSCKTSFVVLRPAAVYGPRDSDFLQLFRAVRAHVLPRFGGGQQPLSLVFVEDLAAATVAALLHPVGSGATFNVAGSEVITTAQLARVVADTVGTWALPLPLPGWGLWPLCVWQEAWSRCTGRPGILSRQKYREARASGWVCDVGRLRDELGFECRTGVREGLGRTWSWYRENGWV